MSVSRSLTILHLSDLHFGKHNRFAGYDQEALGRGFAGAVRNAATDFGLDSQLQLVIVGGDISESANPREFEDAKVFLDSLAGEVGLETNRFVFVPGNHDVSWVQCRKVALDQSEEGFDDDELRSRMDAAKFKNYHEFLKKFFGEDFHSIQVCRSLGSNAWLHEFSDLSLSVAALNTCERESHRPEDHVGTLSREQAQSLMDSWQRAHYDGVLKLIIVHHNPIQTTDANIDAWRTFMKNQSSEQRMSDDLIDRYAADACGFNGSEFLRSIVKDCRANLVLHGHHHDTGDPLQWPWAKNGNCPVLSVGSWGLSPEQLPSDVPLSCQLLRFDLDGTAPRLRAFPLVYDSRFRQTGSVAAGSFRADPAARGIYDQQLSLPSAWNVTGVNSAIEPSVSAKDQRTDAFVRTYRQRMSALCDSWNPRGIGFPLLPGTGTCTTRLSDIYVPLRFSGRREIAETNNGFTLEASALIDLARFRCEVDDRVLNEERETEELTRLPKQLCTARGIVLRGAGGSGKSTWSRYTFDCLLKDNRAFPILVVLRDLATIWTDKKLQGAGRSLDGFLDSWVARYMGSGWEGGLAGLLASDTGVRPILLVDGWDELGPFGKEFRAQLLGFLTQYPQVLAIVTSRPYGEDRPSGGDDFVELEIQPLAPEEIDKLARQFFRYWNRSDEESCARSWTRFRAALDSSRHAAELAQNPLLLTMMLCTSHFDHLPEKRHLLYEKCITNLLTALPEIRRAEGVQDSLSHWRPDDCEERMRALAAMAFAFQKEGQESGHDQAVSAKPEKMIQYLPVEWSNSQRNGFLLWLTEHAGILVDRADGELTFVHLSFQEYLAAWHLSMSVFEAEKAKQVLREMAKARYRAQETILLWAAITNGQNPARLDPIFDVLLEKNEETVSLAGLLLADGIGDKSRFDRWCLLLLATLKEKWNLELTNCIAKWKVCHQDTWRDALVAAMRNSAFHANWLEWTRLEILWREMGQVTTLPLPTGNHAATAAIKAAKGMETHTSYQIAAGRVLTGASPLWPMEVSSTDHPQWVIGLLNTWPGVRRVVSVTVQAAMANGATKVDILRLLKRLVGNSRENGDIHAVSPEAMTLQAQWLGKWMKDRSLNNPTLYLLDVFSSYHSFQMREQDDENSKRLIDFAQSISLRRGCGHCFKGSAETGGDEQLSSDGGQDSTIFPPVAVRWVQDIARSSVVEYDERGKPSIILHLSCSGRILDAGLASLGLDDCPTWFGDFLSFELFSICRAAPRYRCTLFLKRTASEPISLMAASCDYSLTDNPESLRILNSAVTSNLDPLWPALARHVARCSTAEDKELLVKLARNPDLREPPLSWGLKYIVRGDILLPDGSEVAIDELTDELGLPRLPYLEDVPPTIDLDFSAAEDD